ncbi:MAG: serine/threonine-protein phosphatase [Leptospiraceae bacterium]|nr:serine/threonine-protein phosphatase [Leptospiraceae bacterium]MDW7976881.1 PP2C family protein-serine/threonine phosphatase [Leptospiraceae bacterium]
MKSIDVLKLLDQYEVLNKPLQEMIDDYYRSNALLPVYLYENKLINEKKLYQLNQSEFELNESKVIKIKDFEIYGKTYPKYYISGDFFGIFQLKDSRVFITLSDVSGKGLEAGILALMLSYYITHELNYTSLTPQALLKKINQLSLEIFDDIKFATFTILLLDLLSGTIEYAAAGCPPLLHYIHRENTLKEIDLLNIPLGIENDFIFKGKKIDLNPGDVILCYTDGAYEQENKKGQQYGLERLKKALKKNLNKSSKHLVQKLYFDLRFFRMFVPQFDDTTYLVIKYNKKTR